MQDEANPFPHAMLVHANRFQFAPGERIERRRVQSRMLLWRIGGRGKLTINGGQYDLKESDCLFLPWNHRIAYQAAERNPFELAGVHLIPDYRPTGQPLLDVAHESASPLSDSPERKDLPIAGRRGLHQCELSRERALLLLAEYAVESFAQGRQKPRRCRELGRLLLEEIAQVLARAGKAPEGSSSRPEDLQRLMQYITNHLDHPITLEDLVSFSELSASTIGRLFRSGSGLTPMEYVARERLGLARRLLQGSRMRVNQVGQHCGFEDPYYFSRWFKRQQGLSPLAYRRSRPLL